MTDERNMEPDPIRTMAVLQTKLIGEGVKDGDEAIEQMVSRGWARNVRGEIFEWTEQGVEAAHREELSRMLAGDPIVFNEEALELVASLNRQSIEQMELARLKNPRVYDTSWNRIDTLISVMAVLACVGLWYIAKTVLT